MIKAMRVLPVLLVAGVSMASTACASTAYTQRYPVYDRNDRAYYDRGFRDGRESGVEDARRGRSYNINRHGEYRDNRRGDDRRDLVAYRDGFEAGYDQGFGAYDRGRYGDPRRGYPPASTYPYPNPPNSRYPDQRPYYGGGRYVSPAGENGYRDGFDEGQKAARSGDRFDPVREKRYRDGDHNYNDRYGSRDDYKREYRAAFQQGYDEGYRSSRR